METIGTASKSKLWRVFPAGSPEHVGSLALAGFPDPDLFDRCAHSGRRLLTTARCDMPTLWCRRKLRECGAWTVSLSASRSSAVGQKTKLPGLQTVSGVRLAVPDRDPLEKTITFPGMGDHDPLETVITMLWNE
ncbi:hypothetical protein [Bradyrhizobium viridifuturi]|uniref:hypothetical protein n=1 Tax=Bradyrhizobium viridifuturi TaxID=1654716 RepID=UPI00138F2012|nr:hypothetical protein [Bradyrhizobium viridifuturi]